VGVWNLETKKLDRNDTYWYNKTSKQTTGGKLDILIIREWLVRYPECVFPTWENEQRLLA
jgi:hypothetical protein